MNIYRYEQNPLITPADVRPHRDNFEVIGAFNAGVAEYNGEILLLLRVAERPISPDPNIVLAPVYNMEMGDTYYIYFSAVSPVGIGEALVTTQDFKSWTHHGMIFGPDNKDVIIFPEKINGKYYTLHRPTTKSVGRPEIWIAESDNLLYWGNHKHLIGLREGMWDSGRIGGGAVPIKTEQGWLELYHGATKDHRYCMGAVLLDLNDPTKVLARSSKPVMEPEADYEKQGFFGDVVFSCGAIVQGDVVKMYYGVADTSMACAELSLRGILESLEPVAVQV
jgi:beta-1,2-mannobiose phosphorylase / 1,2-beta-oligomannan phosphorylase